MLSFDVTVVALLVGCLIGVLLGLLGTHSIAKRERANLENSKEQLSTALNSAGAENKQLRDENKQLREERAKFEAYAEERTNAIERFNKEKSDLRDELRGKTEAESKALARISELEAELRNERQGMAEKVALLETAEKTLADKFEAISGKIFDEKTKAFTETNKSELGNLLTPLREQLGDFRTKVEEAQKESLVGRTELAAELKQLKGLNESLSSEAHNLATALRRDTKAQGNWGETILRNILDKSGLQEGLHYKFQASQMELDGEGEPLQRRQTDVVVNLPGGRHLVIDSKVSLNAYNDSVNAENEEIRAEATKRHVASVRNHFTELAGRNYHSLAGIESPDFVVMFVPIEPAFLAALQSDEALWHDAYTKGVLLSGPTTVLFVIRIVEDLWRQDKQARNVDEVVKRGAALYDKFVGFTGNLEQVGAALTKAHGAYDEAFKQLRTGKGSLVSQVETLRKLGVKPRQRLSPRLLESAEFDAVDMDLGEDEASGLALAAEGAENGDVR